MTRNREGTTPEQIVLVGQDTHQYEELRQWLSQQYAVEIVDEAVAFRIVCDRTPHLLLADARGLSLQDWRLLRAVRSHSTLGHLPVILLSDRGEEPICLAGLEAGADDYLLTPCSSYELRHRVAVNLKMMRLQQATVTEPQVQTQAPLILCADGVSSEGNPAIADQADGVEAIAAQQTRETLVNALLTDAPIGIAVLDRDLRYVHVNEALAAINGVPVNQHIGRTLWDVLPDWASHLAPVFARVMETKQPLLNQELSGETYPSGMRRYALVNYYPVCLPDGQVAGVGVTSMDITEFKRVEQALEEALQRLTFHVENTPLAVIERDRNFRVTRWSRSAEKIFGWTADEVIGKAWQAIYPEDIEIVRHVRDRLLSGQEKHNLSSNRSYTKDGAVIYCEWYNSALLDESGDLVSVLSLVLDVTERKQAEAERDRLLEREQAARAEAEAANRIKDEFLAVLSHELRSPLNPILGWAKLLRSRRFEQSAVDRALETIERNAKLQTQLIEDLLDISRILRGKISLNVGSVDLMATIEAALETVRLAAEAKGIQLCTLFDGNVGRVSGDANRLQQVIWNLLSNAIKFTPAGGRVDVCIEQVEGQAQIQVKDTGQGISPEFLPFVFDYFRQADGTTTRQFGGLGLGLAIVRYITELHGGSVQAESLGEGCGATFTVRLPLLATPAEIGLSNVVAFSEDAANLTGLQVLLIDDQADMRELGAMLLEQYGATVRVAESAAEALMVLDLSQPDLLISDIGMPEMDGYMLMQKVRSRPPERGGQIPAIALTAYAGEFNQQQALAAGFQRHLSKPVEPEALIQAIAQLVSRPCQPSRP